MELVGNDLKGWVNYSVRRGPVRGELRASVGMTLHIQADPELEQFMQKISNGRTTPITTYGDGWIQIDETPLEVYIIDQNFQTGPNRLYSLGNPGAPLIISQNTTDALGRIQRNSEEKINLAVLSLVGISKPEGVTIGVGGPQSFDAISKLNNLLPLATEQFLKDFITPINVNLHLVSKK